MLVGAIGHYSGALVVTQYINISSVRERRVIISECCSKQGIQREKNIYYYQKFEQDKN